MGASRRFGMSLTKEPRVRVFRPDPMLADAEVLTMVVGGELLGSPARVRSSACRQGIAAGDSHQQK